MRHRPPLPDRGRGIAGWLVLLALVLSVLTLPSAVSAHAVLLDTAPTDGERVEAMPAAALLRFNEPVTPVAVTLVGPGGRTLPPPGPVTVEDGSLRIPLPSPAESGTWLVSYRVTSGDGHPVAGSLLFGLGREPERPAGSDDATGGAAKPASLAASVAAKGLHYASLLVAAGGALFLLAVGAGRAEVQGRIVGGLRPAIGVAALATVANLGFSGVVLSGGPPGSILGAPAWTAAMASSSGTSALVALAGLAVLAVGLLLDRRVAMLAGALAALAALTLTGHAATAVPRWLSLPLVGLHGLVAAFWLGSLWPLLVVLRGSPPEESFAVVRRFSRLAVWGVVVLVVSGAGLSVLQLAGSRTVTDTVYGQVWVAKMLAVALLLAVAVYNRFWLTPALASAPAMTDGGSGARRLVASIRGELVVLGLAVPLLTAGLGSTPPPRALGLDSAEPAYVVASTIRGRPVTVELSPGRTGRNRLTVRLAGPDGKPLVLKEVTAELSLPDAGVEAISRRLAEAEPGTYQLDGLELPVAGRWALRLDLLVSDFEKLIGRVTLEVAR